MENDDICHFRIWQECDKEDKPEDGNFFVMCKSDDCMRTLQDHERLYIELSWGSGNPGHLILLCGNCSFRNKFDCSHPNLKKNGGNGLELIADLPFGNIHICFHDENSEYGIKCKNAVQSGFAPFVKCEGFANIE